MSWRAPTTIAAAFLLVGRADLATGQEVGASDRSTPPAASSKRTDACKIANALSAGPKFITDHATVIDWPSAPDKEMRVLRKGSNGWTCMPGPPGMPRESPMCNDQTMMKWMMAIRAGKRPNIDRIGISYMLQGEGAVGAHVRFAGPHVMLVLPDGDKNAMKDVGRYTPSGVPYVFGPGSPSPLLIIPVAKPDEDIITRMTAAAK